MGRGLDTTPIPLIEQIRSQGRVWEDLAAQSVVTNPEQPWQVNL